MLGADSTLSSRMMANGLPTFSCVTRPKRRAPAVLNLIETTGAPSWSNAWRASTNWSPDTITRRLTAIAPPSTIGSTWLPAGARPCATRLGSASRSTSLNSSRAVCPISALSASGSSTPGTWTRMRRSPWLMTVISLVPCGSMRRRTTSRATVIASLSARASPSLVGTSSTRLNRPRGRPSRGCRSGATGWLSARIRSTAASTCAESRTMKLSRPPAVETSPISIRGSPRRRSVVTSSSLAASRCLAASSESASSSKWLPPARSSPRLIRASGIQPGSLRRLAGRHHAGDGEQDADQDGQHDRPDLPLREIEHQSLAGFAAAGLPTWVSVDLTTMTRMLVPSSTSTSVSPTLVTLPISPPPVTTRSPFLTAAICA